MSHHRFVSNGTHRAIPPATRSASVEHTLTSLTGAGARMHLVNASRQPLVLLHTVTAPAALGQCIRQPGDDLVTTVTSKTVYVDVTC